MTKRRRKAHANSKDTDGGRRADAAAGTAELIKTGKIAVGCCLAYLAAALLGLRYATSAVTITLLSIQNTRRDTFRLAGRRSAPFSSPWPCPSRCFRRPGYTVLSLGLFLLLFTLLCHLFRLSTACP